MRLPAVACGCLRLPPSDPPPRPPHTHLDCRRALPGTAALSRLTEHDNTVITTNSAAGQGEHAVWGPDGKGIGGEGGGMEGEGGTGGESWGSLRASSASDSVVSSARRLLAHHTAADAAAAAANITHTAHKSKPEAPPDALETGGGGRLCSSGGGGGGVGLGRQAGGSAAVEHPRPPSSEPAGSSLSSRHVRRKVCDSICIVYIYIYIYCLLDVYMSCLYILFIGIKYAV